MAEINKVYEVRGALNAHDRMAKGCSDDTDVLVTTTCKCINQVESILALCEGEIVKDPKWGDICYRSLGILQLHSATDGYFNAWPQ